MFKWVKSNTSSMLVTVYPNNLTLNSLASKYFDSVRWTMVGINEKNMQLAIKPITKREIDLNIYPIENLHKISIGNGYARISNKNIINEISKMLNKELDGDKFYASYDEREKLLIVDFSKPC
ncbi:MAG: hypothetical protein WBH68_00005 [Erysipelotrichaceae bacterium]|jgi:hypothetical protein|nr:hypothetical protein [Bacillota bacterium]HCY06234.1 hypothetical protein [Erysipelotrichaceae bacterium]